MRATHWVYLEVLEEVSLNTVEFQYVLDFFVLSVHVLSLDASMNIFKIILLFVIYGYMLQVEKIDIITAAMGHALATEGGFCTGSTRVIDHQVWKCHM